MSVKTTQEAGEIWYHSGEDRHFLLMEYDGKFLWNGASYTNVWKAYNFATGSVTDVRFNSDAPDYDVWRHLG